MIQFLADAIDQLDLALDQLAVGDRNFDRFALMLVDNVAELTLHRFAQDKASENELWSALRQARHDPKAVEKALGQHFEAKVKFAAKLSLVDQATADSVLYLHAFRNTAYHRGLRHEGILHSLAIFYFRCTCALLIAYEPRSWSWGSSTAPSHRAKKYLGTSPYYGLPNDRFRAAYLRLSEVADDMPDNLVEDLARDVTSTVDSVDSAIEFLSTDSPQPMSRDAVVRHSQAWASASTPEAQQFARENGCTASTIGGYVSWLQEHYRFAFPVDPIPSWRSRVASLRGERDYHQALKKYCEFMRQTEDFRATIQESAAQLDGYIEQQVDEARGK